jgi:hypothetical protein
MRRDQLELAIGTACQSIERPDVIVVGSQVILGVSARTGYLPTSALGMLRRGSPLGPFELRRRCRSLRTAAAAIDAELVNPLRRRAD